MPTITRIYRTGSQRHYTIALDCGHKYVVENAMVNSSQLYVGRPGMHCMDCPPANEPLPPPGPPVTFCTAWELGQAIDQLAPASGPHPHSMYVCGPDGQRFSRFHIRQERLTDGSIVHDLVLEGD